MLILAPMDLSKQRKRDRNRDRYRALKLSEALPAVTDSRGAVARPCQQMDRLVLMFNSSANGEILFSPHCQPANPLLLEQTSIKLKLCGYAVTSRNHD